MPTGKIIAAQDHGTIWTLAYRTENGRRDCLIFDHRPFAEFYEGVTERNFFKDYAFGRGREFISRQLKGIRICVQGKDYEQVVCLAGQERGGDDA